MDGQMDNGFNGVRFYLKHVVLVIISYRSQEALNLLLTKLFCMYNGETAIYLEKSSQVGVHSGGKIESSNDILKQAETEKKCHGNEENRN